MSHAHADRRDLKPANILFSVSGAVKLSDLGLASTKQGTRQYNTRRPTAGTVQYMAPECFNTNKDFAVLTDRSVVDGRWVNGPWLNERWVEWSVSYAPGLASQCASQY